MYVYWRLPGLPDFEATRRRASLQHYERLLRSWATETELHLHAPPTLATPDLTRDMGDGMRDA